MDTATSQRRGPPQCGMTVDDLLLNHLSLPPELPQRQDSNLEKIETALISRLEDAANCMSGLPGNTSHDIWSSVWLFLATLRRFTAYGRLDKTAIQAKLIKLDTGGLLTLYVRAQNAAILIYRSSDSEVIFEVFEASARCEDVLSAKSALQWDFPGSAVAVPYGVFCDNNFLESFSLFLEQASGESIKEFAAHTRKAGSSIVEDRDTSDPRLISSMLVALLEANGRRVAPAVLRKRVRDDVLWNNAAVPWRRLPLWLIIRVSIMRQLLRRIDSLDHGEVDSGRARVEYKFFICLVLAGLLDDVRSTTTPDRLSHLKAKLCRRLVKLDTEMEGASAEAVKRYKYYLAHLGQGLNQSIDQASNCLTVRWDAFKESTTRSILPLPRRAEDEALTLTFQANSRQYLRQVLGRFKNSKFQPSASQRQLNRSSDSDDNTRSSEILEPYFKLAQLESELQRDDSSPRELSPEQACLDIARRIRQYVGNVGDHYEFSVEQKSIMLLTVMESWMRLDQEACALLPLLKDYHPSFTPEIMNVLHLPRTTDMKRLRRIQSYLRTRIDQSQSGSLTIFDPPQVEGCFAQRFFDETPEAQRLLDRIRRKSAEDRQAKEDEWAEKNARFETLAREIERSVCAYISDGLQTQNRRYLGSQIHDPACPKCEKEAQLRKIRIQIFEDPLPSDELMCKVLAFELLGCPGFETYRDITWFIIVKLGTENLEPSLPPRCLLRDYTDPRYFARPLEQSFQLVSTTKSFLNTHYANSSFPVALQEVLRANGLKFSYWDQTTETWPRRVRQWPSFAHLCALRLPSSTPLACLTNFFPANKSGPTSYEIIASQAACPAGLNMHEYLAIQNLLAGASRRWISLLVELGSSNINFSTETIAAIVNHIANQCGPEGDTVLGLHHSIFRDSRFCQKLLNQTMHRLRSIASNWREIFAMEIIITIAARTFVLSQECIQSMGSATAQLIDDTSKSILHEAREITLSWVRLLREETKKAADSETSKRYQTYTVWAALLCKRTFDIIDQGPMLLDSEALSTLVFCCITLQDHLATTHDHSDSLKSAIIRDTKMMYTLRDKISETIQNGPQDLLVALSAVWPDVDGAERRIADWSFSPPGCASLRLAPSGEHFREQDVVYNYMHGLLLVDGMAIGKLPSDHRTSVLTELFGSQSLLTSPSRLIGMQYTLCIRPCGHQIHVGFLQDSTMVIRACKGSKIFEFVPRHVFGTQRFFDLPGPLIDGHFHWLDLSNGKLEIRPKRAIWMASQQHWNLDVHSGKCTRTRGANRDVLLDPHSRFFHRAARNLEGLTARHHILIYQRQLHFQRPNIRVDLPQLQLSFYVNSEKVLCCPQYQAAVAYNQDIGTWHGLRSMLVLQDLNSGKRMVLVPFGQLDVQRDGDHVQIEIQGTGAFGRFSVNEILGRVDCAPEPRLIYQKALLHALTSFPIPDNLTGMTGTEAALHWLSSGLCQSWHPLGASQMEILRSLSRLTPRREYYPEALRVMKKESWDPRLTTTMQHDAFGEVVKRIVSKSEALRLFYLNLGETSVPSIQGIQSYGDPHLNIRSWMRWQSNHRISSFTKPPQEVGDVLYVSRDREDNGKRMYSDVFDVAFSIGAQPLTLRTELNLAVSLSQSSLILGYSEGFDQTSKVSISDRLKVDLKREWGVLVSLARKYRAHPFSLMFIFAPMVFLREHGSNMDLMRTILAFALFEELAAMKLPVFEKYDHFRINQIPDKKYLSQLANPARLPAPYDERESIPNLSGKLRRQLNDQKRKHEQQSEEDCETFAQHLLSQWPCAEPKLPDNTGERVDALRLDVSRAMDAICPEWKRLYENMELQLHLETVQKILARRYTDMAAVPFRFTPRANEPLQNRSYNLGVPLIEDLMKRGLWQPPCIVHKGPAPLPSHGQVRDTHSSFAQSSSNEHIIAHSSDRSLQTSQWERHAKISAAIQELTTIVNPYASSKSRAKKRYGRDLLSSLEAFKTRATAGNLDSQETASFKIRESSALMRQLSSNLDLIARALANTAHPNRNRWLKQGTLYPIVTPVSLLEQLRSTAGYKLHSTARDAILDFGMTVTTIQRQLRLNELALRRDMGGYTEEQSNPGHLNWKPQEYPDWLLLEIESNVLIRPGQVDVALATISPSSSSNSVMQMSMGQGKTSVVIPMVSVVLADGKSLARVVVPKALLQQNAQLLHSRLGGLLGRELCHIPFSRKTSTEPKTLRTYELFHSHILKTAGVMLCLPEHGMSFMLSGHQNLQDGKLLEAQSMIRIHRWLRGVSRDVLDESDYTLAVRTQLIYPSGGQMTVDGHPHRWLVAESVLRHVQAHVRALKKLYPRSLEVVWRKGAFPFVFFLRSDVEEELLQRITNDVLNGRTGMLPITGLSAKDRVAMKEFLANEKVRPSTLERIKSLCPDKPHIRQIVYLLRGLLVNRILLMTLKKRWNVQYGLNPSREPIAVPFHAKGVASESSEWGHPDVSILLTCLSFYYEGISLAHLKQSLEHLLKSDDPSQEYNSWTSSPGFPDSLRDWHSINPADDVQLMDIWTAVRYNVVVVDYFLNNFCFPLHAKQFKVKLMSNGWDIPLLPVENNGTSGRPPVLTTGFSGTNDSHTMLPLTIKQQDLPGLSHTNAEVLTYLLHERNRDYVLMENSDGTRLGEERFLRLLRDKGIRILIDAGAQILEMDNLTLIKTWMEIDTRAPGALYFDANNKPWILARRSMTLTPLLASQYADNLHECLIYLDDAHTRGTDLKLPPMARGALTLGPGQTKDHTVQAAMRLRQLGTTQSVSFFAPPEVHQSIMDLKGEKAGDVDSRDVINWLLNNTCQSIEQLQPLFYSQGVDFCKRMQAAVDFPDFLSDKVQRERYIAAIRQDEQQTLEQLYGPKKTKSKTAALEKATDPRVCEYLAELQLRRKNFEDTRCAVSASALQEVEQEREIEIEVESVRQVKKAVQYPAYSYPGLHKDLVIFAHTGRLPAQSLCASSVMGVISRTGLGRKFGVSPKVQSNLLASVEFEKTVKQVTERLNDNFLRPVQWILWSEVSQTAIIVIPEEAEGLIPIVRDAEYPKAFLLTYAAPVTRKMLQFNKMAYYTIPALPQGWQAPLWLKIELGMFAGRLYFEWEEHAAMCKFHGTDAEEEDQLSKVGDTDGANESRETTDGATAKKGGATTSFGANPLTFLQEWLAVRRRGQDFANSPLGFLTQGKPLSGDESFFRQEEESEQTLRSGLCGVTSRIAAAAAAAEEVDEVAFEAGEIDVPVSELDASSSSDSDVEYHDDELYSNYESDEEESEPLESSSGEERNRGTRRGGYRGRGGGGRAGRGRGRGR